MSLGKWNIALWVASSSTQVYTKQIFKSFNSQLCYSAYQNVFWRTVFLDLLKKGLFLHQVSLGKAVHNCLSHRESSAYQHISGSESSFKKLISFESASSDHDLFKRHPSPVFKNRLYFRALLYLQEDCLESTRSSHMPPSPLHTVSAIINIFLALLWYIWYNW